MLRETIKMPKEFIDNIYSITRRTIFPGSLVERTKTVIEVFPRILSKQDFAEWIKEAEEVLE